MDSFDPDEQAILRLMHENMRDWDEVNLINTDQLRKKFQEADPYNTQIMNLREVNILYLFYSLQNGILKKSCSFLSRSKT